MTTQIRCLTVAVAIATLAFGVGACGSSKGQAQPPRPPSASSQSPSTTTRSIARIGTYDARAIAVAYAPSEFNQRIIHGLIAEADKAKQAAAQSEELRQQAEAMRQQAEKEKQEMRARLLQQLNSVLATRDTARGLIANMSDVLFKSGSFELLPGARERLAKVSGIVLAYQGLHLAIEGHTDSIGTDEYNRHLSEQRAQAVSDYLIAQGISSDVITASQRLVEQALRECR